MVSLIQPCRRISPYLFNGSDCQDRFTKWLFSFYENSQNNSSFKSIYSVSFVYSHLILYWISRNQQCLTRSSMMMPVAGWTGYPVAWGLALEFLVALFAAVFAG